MAKVAAKDPGTVVKSFLDEYQLNPSKLGKEVELSQSTIRQITLNKIKISIPIALRFAKYFGNSVEYWLDLQTKYSLAEAEGDKELNDVLKRINKVSKPSPAEKPAGKAPQKPDTKKAASSNKNDKTVKKTAPNTQKAPNRPRGKKTN